MDQIQATVVVETYKFVHVTVDSPNDEDNSGDGLGAGKGQRPHLTVRRLISVLLKVVGVVIAAVGVLLFLKGWKETFETYILPSNVEDNTLTTSMKDKRVLAMIWIGVSLLMFSQLMSTVFFARRFSRVMYKLVLQSMGHDDNSREPPYFTQGIIWLVRGTLICGLLQGFIAIQYLILQNLNLFPTIERMVAWQRYNDDQEEAYSTLPPTYDESSLPTSYERNYDDYYSDELSGEGVD